MYKFVIDRYYTRGNRMGHSDTMVLEFPTSEGIYAYLWDVSEKYDSNKLHFIVEHYLRTKK